MDRGGKARQVMVEKVKVDEEKTEGGDEQRKRQMMGKYGEMVKSRKHNNL